jgi:hypothetical protein
MRPFSYRQYMFLPHETQEMHLHPELVFLLLRQGTRIVRLRPPSFCAFGQMLFLVVHINTDLDFHILSEIA